MAPAPEVRIRHGRLGDRRAAQLRGQRGQQFDRVGRDRHLPHLTPLHARAPNAATAPPSALSRALAAVLADSQASTLFLRQSERKALSKRLRQCVKRHADLELLRDECEAEVEHACRELEEAQRRAHNNLQAAADAATAEFARGQKAHAKRDAERAARAAKLRAQATWAGVGKFLLNEEAPSAAASVSRALDRDEEVVVSEEAESSGREEASGVEASMMEEEHDQDDAGADSEATDDLLSPNSRAACERASSSAPARDAGDGRRVCDRADGSIAKGKAAEDDARAAVCDRADEEGPKAEDRKKAKKRQKTPDSEERAQRRRLGPL